MIFNKIIFTPVSTAVRGRILSYDYRAGVSDGGTRSVPAELGSTKLSGRTRATGPKEHPEKLSTSLPSLEPAKAPTDDSTLG